MTEEIKFYSIKDKFGEFSNFALYPIKLKGKIWPTSEHYFQVQKFGDKEYQEKIRNAPSPMKAAELGRKVKIIRNWDNIRDNIMYDAVKAKFSQHLDLKELLLNTGDAKLIEHTENDDYWGDGRNGQGLNKLGKILMTVRKEFLK